MTVTDNELALLAEQRLPGFELVKRLATELRDARKRLERLQTELAQAKTAATYGAKMVADIRGRGP
jgi:predicted  nucleic acid-binding Zn-ribbon protein